VKDSFYVVSIGIEDECGVVRGVIVRPQTRPSVVDPSCLLFLDPEVSTIVRREAGSLRALDNPDTEGLQRTLVERATLCDVAHAQRHVIKQGGGLLGTSRVSRSRRRLALMGEYWRYEMEREGAFKSKRQRQFV
jgi:hypothetical protein